LNEISGKNSDKIEVKFKSNW